MENQNSKQERLCWHKPAIQKLDITFDTAIKAASSIDSLDQE